MKRLQGEADWRRDINFKCGVPCAPLASRSRTLRAARAVAPSSPSMTASTLRASSYMPGKAETAFPGHLRKQRIVCDRMRRPAPSGPNKADALPATGRNETAQLVHFYTARRTFSELLSTSASIRLTLTANWPVGSRSPHSHRPNVLGSMPRRSAVPFWESPSEVR